MEKDNRDSNILESMPVGQLFVKMAFPESIIGIFTNSTALRAYSVTPLRCPYFAEYLSMVRHFL